MIDQSINTIDTGPDQDMSDGGTNASPNLSQHQNQHQLRPESSHKKLNFAAALTKNLPARRTRDQIRADFKQLEDDTVKDDWNNVHPHPG
jgi:cytochrome c556